MRGRSFNSLKATGLVVLIILITGQADMLPWWSFIIPVLFLGVLIAIFDWDVRTVAAGFAGGCIAWPVANFVFHIAFRGHILFRFGWPAGIGLLILSGVVCGLVTGFALYSGKCVVLSLKPTIKPTR
jgi:hypothetical protein